MPLSQAFARVSMASMLLEMQHLAPTGLQREQVVGSRNW